MGEEGAIGDGITLRSVEIDDLEMLRQHRNEWGTRRWLEDSGYLSVEDQRSWFDLGCHLSVRVAMSESVPVGIARVNDLHDGKCYVGGDVFSAYRRRGFGKLVFDAACNEAISYHANRLILWVFLDNVAAVKIYKAAGFSFDLDAPTKTFLRPDAQGGEVFPRIYAKMQKVVNP